MSSPSYIPACLMPATHVFVAAIARKLGLHAVDLFVLQASMCIPRFDCLQALSFS
jgi:hypothetical protein